MIGKSSKGRGFYGTFRYVLEEGQAEKDKDAHIIGGNMMGSDARELSKEAGEIRRIKPEIKQPVWHVSLSFPPGEMLTDAQMQQASDRFLAEMGLPLDRHQHLYVRHHDTEHAHVHLVVNRISDEGKVFDLHNDYYRIQSATRKLEQELGLQVTPERGANHADHLREHITETAQQYPHLNDFCAHLTASGITPVFTIRRGKLSGLSYRYERSETRGSKLGNAYSFQGLQRHLGIHYDPARDDPWIRPRYVKQRDKRKEKGADKLREQQQPTVQQLQPQQREQSRPELDLER
ncbi:MAG: relaxase/mobilization nuclease domain-containing protein [Cyanobacteria bacterium P01_A01_bin.17]